MDKQPVLLMILDGWGINDHVAGNAIAAANLPVYRQILQECPHAQLDASGEAVGLPDGQMGNSEVGHLNLGAGRIVYQDSTRISKSIRDGDFFHNPVFLKAIDAARNSGGAIHLMGLLSDGGVHSRLDHIFALIDLLKRQKIERVYFHAFLDGRDTPPASALKYIEQLEEHLADVGVGRIATVTGRYYAMDRDKRWDRVQKAYEAIVEGRGDCAITALSAVQRSYELGKTDEFMAPAVICDAAGIPIGRVHDNDTMIFCNFRSDRAREITRCLTDAAFTGFPRTRMPRLSLFVCMTTYDESSSLPVAFGPVRLFNILGEVLSTHGIRQLRIAETEKYAHVTFFFNGGEETPFANEDRILVPSPREVATYDLKPEMSAPEVTAKLLDAMRSRQYPFILVNYANPDMVGHTGVVQAAVAALETLDRCIGNVLAAAKEMGFIVLITADHGNVEIMFDPATGQPHTAHTTDPVPFIVVNKHVSLLTTGILADVAPTVLQLMGLAVPTEMTGKSLLKNIHD